MVPLPTTTHHHQPPPPTTNDKYNKKTECLIKNLSNQIANNNVRHKATMNTILLLRQLHGREKEALIINVSRQISSLATPWYLSNTFPMLSQRCSIDVLHDLPMTFLFQANGTGSAARPSITNSCRFSGTK